MDTKILAETAKKLVAPKKGILAADESSNTIKSRFDSINVESNEANRRDYRQMLFTTSGISQFISGVILFDETMRQKDLSGKSLVSILSDQDIVPGIKVDTGAKPLAGSTSETITEGLDNLRERLNEYRELGALFTKWRGVINIGKSIPSPYAINVNAHALARFAALSQEAGLVPIVEPEVLMDGEHSIEKCFEITEQALKQVYLELEMQNIYLEGTLLKPNMVLSGKSAKSRANTTEVAQKTVECLLNNVPHSVPGIVFLSGGQSDEEATTNLNTINQIAKTLNAPWELSFSYGRGLQAAPLKAWLGKKTNILAAQSSFFDRAKLTSIARQGLL